MEDPVPQGQIARLRRRGAALLLSATAGTLVAAAEVPEDHAARDTLARFYDSVRVGDCATAGALWPGYGKLLCEGGDQEELVRAEALETTAERALVYAEVQGRRSGMPYREAGCVRLQRTDAGWRIRAFAERLCPTDMARTDMARTDIAQTDTARADASAEPATIAAPSLPEPSSLLLPPRPVWIGPSSIEPAPAERPPPAPDLASAAVPRYETRIAPDAADIAPGMEPLPLPRVRVPVSAGSFGSKAILDACWTPEALRGSPADRHIQKPLPPDLSGPPEAAVQAAAHALPPLSPRLRESIRSVEPGDPHAKLIALTFDLCEQANERTGYQAGLVELLRREDVRATFFAGGKWMRSHPEQTMQLQADPRFEVGNHAWTHGNLRVLHGPEMRAQILWTQAQYRLLRDELAARPCARDAGGAELARIPAYPTTFRFPYGTCDRESLDALAGYGLAAIQWSIVTADPWKGQTADGIVRAVLKGVADQRGAIVIAHANGRGRHTTEAMTRLIPALRGRGFDFVTVSELLAAGDARAELTCYELRPGDNARYDTLFGRGTGDGLR
jgi:peptidoglycan-N-acetylglucosamine deacetylase